MGKKAAPKLQTAVPSWQTIVLQKAKKRPRLVCASVASHVSNGILNFALVPNLLRSSASVATAVMRRDGTQSSDSLWPPGSLVLLLIILGHLVVQPLLLLSTYRALETDEEEARRKRWFAPATLPRHTTTQPGLSDIRTVPSRSKKSVWTWLWQIITSIPTMLWRVVWPHNISDLCRRLSIVAVCVIILLVGRQFVSAASLGGSHLSQIPGLDLRLTEASWKAALQSLGAAYGWPLMYLNLAIYTNWTIVLIYATTRQQYGSAETAVEQRMTLGPV